MEENKIQQITAGAKNLFMSSLFRFKKEVFKFAFLDYGGSSSGRELRKYLNPKDFTPHFTSSRSQIARKIGFASKREQVGYMVS